MKQAHLWLGLGGIVIFVGGFWAGRLSAPGQPAINCDVQPCNTAELTTHMQPLFPTFDAPGSDIEGLPRHPNARRVDYSQRIVGNLLVTDVEYLVPAVPEVVREFYRDVFDAAGWKVADLGFFEGKWTFLVINEEREAMVEIESPRTLIEVEISLSEPLTGTSFGDLELVSTAPPDEGAP